jgi:hypothetical protein
MNDLIKLRRERVNSEKPSRNEEDRNVEKENGKEER